MMVGKIVVVICVFFFQAEDGIRDLVRSRGLGDVYKRQPLWVHGDQWIGPSGVDESFIGALHYGNGAMAQILSLIHI